MNDPRQVPSPHVAAGSPTAARGPDVAAGPPDPLRLCVFSTVALLGWLLGPWALVVFASAAVVGYARARRAGLLRSRCKLGDTRLVLAYLVVLAGVAAAAIIVPFVR